MAEAGKPQSDLPLEDSLPKAGASLESILCTEELQSRPSRPPDYEKENRALVKLVSALADSPRTIFATLADTILDITQADSAGLSLLTRDGKTPDAGGKRFYWPAITGMWNAHVGGGTPRNFGPCGDVLDQNRTLLFRHFERRYPYLVPVIPAAEECLLVPFHVGGEAVGTIWAIMHSDRHRFDAEDDRVMASLGKFASSAYQAQESARLYSEERYRVVVETASDAVVSMDDEGSIVFANPATARIFGYDPAELAGKPLTLLMPEYMRELHRSGLKRHLAAGQRHINWQGTELTALRKNGEEFPVEVSFGEISRDGHRVFTGFLRDISKRKQAEQALRRSEAFLAEGQRLGKIGSFSWRVATDEITWSEQLYHIYELETGVPVSLELIRSRVHPEDVTLYEKMVEQARNGCSNFEWHYRLKMPDHSIKYLHALAHATRDQDGQLEYIAAIQDVTARRRSEEALDKARSELAHVARIASLGVMTASIAHELNQPLSGIVTNAGTCLRMLGADPPNADGARETARRTIRDAHRASEMITRLRALFGKKESMFESIDLNEVTREVLALTLNELQRHRVILRPELSDNLPLVAGDRIQLQEVILNLLRNASDAMSAVEDRPRWLVVRTERDEGDGVRLSVKDTGTGFEPQAADRLFEAFYTTKGDGMGIGLSISRSIIEAHQGRLWATANDGPGATFSFAIPCRSKGLAKEPKTAPRAN